MELKKVDINNYKSIEHIKMDIEKDCKILVGVSGSGKTNMLNAFRTLDENINVDSTHVKEGTRKEASAYIDFELVLTKDEKKIVCDELLKDNPYLNKIVVRKGKELPLQEFIDDRLVFRVNIRENNRQFLYYARKESQEDTINEKFAYVNAKHSNKVVLTNAKDDTSLEIESFKVICKDDYIYDNECNISELYTILEQKIINIVEEKEFEIPKVLYWEYDDNYLLPSEVKIEDFVNNRDICVPLKNMFELCNIENIKEEYEDKIAMGESSFQNLLDDISDTVDDYLKKVWKSMPKNTKIVLQEVGNKIKIRIKDSKNSYSISKRSDGFKRLVTFLLMLSIDNKKKMLTNTLILIDEPDSKIDIPGQEYLKNELINIGKNNYVIYSTHSTNMIDNNKIERHIMIKKENENSIVEQANEDNYTDVATLYRALGMNVYSVINENNVVFEGWTDQLVFELAVGKRNPFFKTVGITHLSGITKVNQYAEFWGLLSKNYYIISDADDTAVQMKASFTENRYNGKWLMYNELSNENIITLEDFISNERIIKTAKEFQEENSFSTELLEEMLNCSDGKASAIEQWIILNNGKSNAKSMMKKFKVKLYTGIKKSDILEEYYIFVENLKSNLLSNKQI